MKKLILCLFLVCGYTVAFAQCPPGTKLDPSCGLCRDANGSYVRTVEQEEQLKKQASQTQCAEGAKWKADDGPGDCYYPDGAKAFVEGSNGCPWARNSDSPEHDGRYWINCAITKSISIMKDMPSNHQVTVVNGISYYNYKGEYFKESLYGGYMSVWDPTVFTTGSPVIINVPNADGSQSVPVTLIRQKFCNSCQYGWMGPKGEYYEGMPSVEQLKILYSGDENYRNWIKKASGQMVQDDKYGEISEKAVYYLNTEAGLSKRGEIDPSKLFSEYSKTIRYDKILLEEGKSGKFTNQQLAIEQQDKMLEIMKDIKEACKKFGEEHKYKVIYNKKLPNVNEEDITAKIGDILKER